MGADIHDWAEVKRNGRWEAVGEVFDDPYYRPEHPPDEWNQPKTQHPFRSRNYRVFTILAGVRNDGGVQPIAGARGVPDDASDAVREQIDDYGPDGHDHS